jgi:hypothetical protein
MAQNSSSSSVWPTTTDAAFSKAHYSAPVANGYAGIKCVWLSRLRQNKQLWDNTINQAYRLWANLLKQLFENLLNNYSKTDMTPLWLEKTPAVSQSNAAVIIAPRPVPSLDVFPSAAVRIGICNGQQPRGFK